MAWLIAKKDFLLNLISTRFIIAFLLCLFLIPFTVIVNVNDYQNRLRVYQVEKAKAEKEFKQTRVYSGVRPEIVKPPQALSIFCKGISNNVGNRVTIYLGKIPLFAQGKTAERDNPLLNSFFSIDFINVIAIIMSLLALVFSYDIFSKEKENGTLKLIFSNRISRSSFLSGKIAGIYLTLIPILLFNFILSCLIIIFSQDVSLTANDWLHVALLFFASFIYMSFFIFLSTFISSKVKCSITSIIINLFLWIWFLFLFPNISTYLVKTFSKVGLYENMKYAMDQLDNEFSDKCVNFNNSFDIDRDHFNLNGGYDGYFETTGDSREVIDFEIKIKTFKEPLRIDYADKKWVYQKKYLDDLMKQKKLAKSFAWFSPSDLFENISSSLCQTNTQEYNDFMSNVRDYRKTFVQYFVDNKMFELPEYITPQDINTFPPKKKLEKMWNSIKCIEDCPPSWFSNYYPYLDLSDIPVFKFHQTSLIQELSQSIIKLSFLVIISIIFFYLTVLSFRKYDLR
ncbi:MAG: ABC transporter permease subunit [Bacteroidetes bacterium]|nr:ABC transporter permease subunit [Bacteroidota bacterium]